MEEITAEDIKTVGYDRRFPSTNQARTCYTRYNEFYKCKKQKGEGSEECEKFRTAVLSLCPTDWVEKWEEQRANDTWPGKY
jgi:cytochrome c oxidase subunit 6b